jgi:PD-(D/E)XK nuclease superfamily
MSDILTDRSRIECYQQCPRRRWWAYEYRGRGIEPVRGQPSYLAVGSAIHTGIGSLLLGDGMSWAYLGVYDALRQGLDAPIDDRAVKRQAELYALVEALLRAWGAVRLPYYRETFEVLDVEREEEPFDIGVGIKLMVRTDAVVRRKADGAVFIANWKTAKRCDRLWQEQWKYDPQTLSEVLPVEKRLGEKVSGVLIEGLVKGEELEYPKGSGEWYYNSPLIWAWHNETGKPHPRGDWSARYEWQDEDGSHRLGKGWRKAAVWESFDGGVAAWIEHLAQSDPMVLEEQFVPLPPILRSDWEIERWTKQVAYQERDIREASCLLRSDEFPMHTGHGNCIRPSRCPFIPICWEGADPDDERYRPRTPNHSTELVQIERGGE